MFHVKHELILTSSHRVEFEERRSRFIGVAFFVDSERAFREILGQIKTELSGATHYCWAFQIGLGNTKSHGASDDGEPRGTAGRPILEVLKGSGITQCGICVVRYFGGTLLGTGGLVKAYTEAAKRVLAEAISKPWIPGDEWQVQVSYEFHNLVLEVCRRLRVEVLEETFDESIHLHCFVPEEIEEDFVSHMVDTTRGQVVLNKKE